MKYTSFDHTLERLRVALSSPLPGPAAQFRMSPEGPARGGLSRTQRASCREGAVLVVLYPRMEETTLVLTRRPDFLPDHPGQISLPGGRRDRGEELIDTARRECLEELGIAPSSLEILGTLSPLYVTVSNYCVYPFVGALARRPSFFANPQEVSELIEVPLHRLSSPSTRQTASRLLRGRQVSVPFFSLYGHQVWGATAMILAEFLALLENPDPNPDVEPSGLSTPINLDSGQTR